MYEILTKNKDKEQVNTFKNLVKMANTLQMTDKIAVVLDLGTTRIRSVAAVLDDNNKVSQVIATEEVDSKGVRHGRVENYIELAGVIKPMFNRLSNRIYNKFKTAIGDSFIGNTVEIKSVYIALGGKGILGKEQKESYRLNNQFVDVPVVQKIEEDIRKRVENDKEIILDMINQGYNVDDDIKMEAVGCRASNVEGRFCVVTAEKEIKEDIEKTLSSINIQLAGYSLLPFALADVMLSDADKEVGATLIDLGASSTSIAIYRDNVRRHIRVLPFGGKIITKDIKKVCGLTTETAEKIKKNIGCAYPEGLKENVIVSVAGTDVKIQSVELASIIEARLEELISYLLGEMNKVSALTSSKKIILTGRGARLDKVCDKFTNEFGLDTEIGKIKDVCYEKYSSYFASLDSVNGNPDKTARKMNEFAACLGVLESCALDSCVYVGRKGSADVKADKKAEEKVKKEGSIVKRIFTLFDPMVEKATSLIDGTEMK